MKKLLLHGKIVMKPEDYEEKIKPIIQAWKEERAVVIPPYFDYEVVDVPEADRTEKEEVTFIGYVPVTKLEYVAERINARSFMASTGGERRELVINMDLVNELLGELIEKAR